jgi:hypothetical protein
MSLLDSTQPVHDGHSSNFDRLAIINRLAALFSPVTLRLNRLCSTLDAEVCLFL